MTVYIRKLQSKYMILQTKYGVYIQNSIKSGFVYYSLSFSRFYCLTGVLVNSNGLELFSNDNLL